MFLYLTLRDFFSRNHLDFCVTYTATGFFVSLCIANRRLVLA